MTHAPGAASATTTTDDNYTAFPPGMQRLAAASGLIFLVLIILSIVVNTESVPDMDAAPAEFLDYVAEEKDNIELSTLFGALAGIEWLWFIGVVTAALSRAETLVRGFTRVSWTTFAGGLMAVTLIAASGALLVTATATPEGTEPSVARALVNASGMCFTAASAGFAAMFASAGIVILRANALPRWLGFLALLASLFYVLTLFTFLLPEDDGGAFEIFWPLSLLTFAIWVAGTSVTLLRRVGKPATATPAGS